MSLADDFLIVFRNISHRRLRSWLTVLGVVIGIAAIVALVSVSRSLELSIEREFEEFGTDKVTVLPRTGAGATPGFGTGLNEDDVDAVRRVGGLEFAEPALSKSGKISYRDESVNTLFVGWDSGMAETLFDELSLDFASGASFTSDSRGVVVGSRAASGLFERELSLRSKVEIESEKFEVVGILEPVGNPTDDSAIYMPLVVMRDVFNEETAVSMIIAKVNPGSDIDEAAERIRSELSDVRSEESFSVVTPEQLLEQLGAVLGIIQGVLVGIAAISLLVGSVGIANSMFTSVIERTRDIGIMKAVGATRSDITAIFVMEAGLVGLIGGVIGVALGVLIAQVIGIAAAQAGFGILKIVVEPWLLAFGVVFAVVVGMASGFIPARQAASLKPVEALRK